MLMVVSFSAALANGQSLGDVARKARNQRKADKGKVYTNDNLPGQETIAVVGQPSKSSDASAEDQSKKQPSDKSADDKTADSASGDGDQKQSDAAGKDKKSDEKTDTEKRDAEIEKWRKQFAAQRDKIALLQREFDVTQREYRLRAAAMYGDVGNRLRNQKEWDQQDRDYRAELETKQKALDDAKQKLEAMKEEARRQGLPASVSE
jgi:hypothetical protein